MAISLASDLLSTPPMCYSGARGRHQRAVLAPSRGPTQAGTTLTLAFRVIIGADGEEEMEKFGGFQYAEIVASDQDGLQGSTEETIPRIGGVIDSLAANVYTQESTQTHEEVTRWRCGRTHRYLG